MASDPGCKGTRQGETVRQLKNTASDETFATVFTMNDEIDGRQTSHDRGSISADRGNLWTGIVSHKWNRFTLAASNC